MYPYQKSELFSEIILALQYNLMLIWNISEGCLDSSHESTNNPIISGLRLSCIRSFLAALTHELAALKKNFKPKAMNAIIKMLGDHEMLCCTAS